MTKFDIGEKVWFWEGLKLKECVVVKDYIEMVQVGARYMFEPVTKPKEDCFKSKQEAIDAMELKLDALKNE